MSEPYPEENARFLKENGITHHQIGMPGNKETCITPVPDEKITAALRVILDRRNHPILIHCNKGKVRRHISVCFLFFRFPFFLFFFFLFFSFFFFSFFLFLSFFFFSFSFFFLFSFFFFLFSFFFFFLFFSYSFSLLYCFFLTCHSIALDLLLAACGDSRPGPSRAQSRSTVGMREPRAGLTTR